jgi:Pectate lyase superfamily protein
MVLRHRPLSSTAPPHPRYQLAGMILLTSTEERYCTMTTLVSKRTLSVGLGVGGLALLAQRASADTPFTRFAFPVTRGTTARTLPDRLAEVKNVKDFGAVGNGSRDDTQAIRDAMAATAQPGGGIIFFPVGRYKVGSTIYLDGPAGDGSQPNNSYMFLGEGDNGNYWGSFIDNTSNRGACFKRVNGQSQQQTLVWQGLMIHGGLYGIFFVGGSGIRIQDCTFTSAQGVVFQQTIGRQLVSNCTFGGSNAPGTIGIYSNGNCVIQSSTLNGKDHGIRCSNIGTTIQGCQFEKNNVGVMLGMHHTEGVGFDSCKSVSVADSSFESNIIGVHFRAAVNCTVRNCSMTSSRGAVGTNSEGKYGIYMTAAAGSMIDNVEVNGEYVGGAVVCAGGFACIIQNLSAQMVMSVDGAQSSGSPQDLTLFYGTSGHNNTNVPWLVAGLYVTDSAGKIPAGTTITSFPTNTKIRLSARLSGTMPDLTQLTFYDPNHVSYDSSHPGRPVGGLYIASPMGQQFTTRPIPATTYITGSITLDGTVHELIEANSGSGITITVPKDLDLGPARAGPGTEYRVIQLGAGQVTVSAGTGATVDTETAGTTNKTSGQYGVLHIRKSTTAANHWQVWRG